MFQTAHSELIARFRNALQGLVDGSELPSELIYPTSVSRYGDYQANFAMPLSKKLSCNSLELAEKIINRVEIGDFCYLPIVTRPGFINIRLRDEWIALQLAHAASHEDLGIPKVSEDQRRTYVIDYSSPNVAKPMHVGHIRSTIIGNSLDRILRFLGHKVVSINHLGDWGTQFGMLIYGYKYAVDKEAYNKNPIKELARLYQYISRLMGGQEDVENLSPYPDIVDEIAQETADLHAGNEENRALWREFMPHCREELDRTYKRLGIHFDYMSGESDYQIMLEPLVDDLIASGIAHKSDGAVCITIEGCEIPMIVRKRNGAYLYATTDLAAIRGRILAYKPDTLLYVVDHRQSLHFKQLFAATRLMGYKDVELEHVSFGTISGENGRPFKTRTGDFVGLNELIDAAVQRAMKIVSDNDDAKQNGPELSAKQRAEIAESVGIGALKYADLSHNRSRDYVFSYDTMLAMKGNTGAYMQYAYARIQSILTKGDVNVRLLRATNPSIKLNTPAERDLGLAIIRFREIIDRTAAYYRPSDLTDYLFELANCYSTFYQQCPVLKADNQALRDSRFLLCDLTARTIRQGLSLLGIEVVDKM